MTQPKWIFTEDQRDAVCKGELCPACLGTNIEHVGCVPDGMRANHAYDCKDCPAKWEGIEMATEQTKLDSGQKHLLQLVVREARPDGWTPLSKAVFPLVEKLPQELIELERVGEEGRGRVRLTPDGESVVNAMTWLGG